MSVGAQIVLPVLASLTAGAVADTLREFLVKLRARRLLRRNPDPALREDLLRLQQQRPGAADLAAFEAQLASALTGLTERERSRLEKGFHRRSTGANLRFAADLLDVS